MEEGLANDITWRRVISTWTEWLQWQSCCMVWCM